jgi:hypothetical protein
MFVRGKNNSDEARTPEIRKYQNRRYNDKDAAAVLVELLKPGAWIAPDVLQMQNKFWRVLKIRPMFPLRSAGISQKRRKEKT